MTCTLGDVIKLQRGHDLPERVRVDGPVPIVSLIWYYGRHNVAKADPPGVVTGRYGTIGEVLHLLISPTGLSIPLSMLSTSRAMILGSRHICCETS